MGMTTYQANAHLDDLDGMYFALFTAAPSDAGGGTEVSASGYARQAISLSAASSRAVTNDADIEFGPAGANWGTITHGAIFDASSSGNMLWWDDAAVSKAVTTGEWYVVYAGDLDINIAAS